MKNKINEKLIELKNIHVNIKNNIENIHILKGIDLTIHTNTSISITGESGAGKSTLAMTIAGLELISKGKIFFKNKPIHNVRVHYWIIYLASLIWKNTIFSNIEKNKINFYL